MHRCKNIMPVLSQYVTDITVRFGELYDDPMVDSKALRQTGNV